MMISTSNENNEVNVFTEREEALYGALLLCGASVAVVDGRLKVGPARLLTPEIREAIAQHRDALIRLVEAGTGLNDADALYEKNEGNELNAHDPRTWPGELTPELEALIKPEWFSGEPVAVHLLSDAEGKALSLYSVLTGERYQVEPTPAVLLPKPIDADRSAA